MRQSALLAARTDIHIGENAVDDEDWNFSEEDTQYLLHNLHPYPARFIPQIPRRAIERWSRPGDLVLDPFCGSGTTLLESKLLGRNSIGVDSNGVATLVASAKVQEYREASLRALENAASEASSSEVTAGRGSASSLDSLGWVPSYRSIWKWFDPRAIIDLAVLRARIENLPPDAKLLGLAVLSSVIVRSSRQDSDTRYVATRRPYKPSSAAHLWRGRARRAATNARATGLVSRPSIHSVVTRDSRLMPEVGDETVQLVVTSPPYLNAYDYHKYHRHRLEWLAADVDLARDAEIGKHDTFSRKGATPDRYFEDLGTCMLEWRRVMATRARALVVVSDGIVSGSFVPVAERLIGTARNCGLDLERRWIRNVDVDHKSFNRSARIKREHLLLFHKSE